MFYRYLLEFRAAKPKKVTIKKSPENFGNHGKATGTRQAYADDDFGTEKLENSRFLQVFSQISDGVETIKKYTF